MRFAWLAAIVAAAVCSLPLVLTEIDTAFAVASNMHATGGAHKRQGHGRHRHILLGASYFPDYLDPQLSFDSVGWTAMYDTYIPLLTYRHASGKAGSEVIPGLARSLPRITDGDRTYTLFLRPGLRYSNGQLIKASDFKFAVERMFRLNSVGSFFYTDIIGVHKFRRTKRGGIGGIATNDTTGKITIHLIKPRGTFTDELALIFTAPVPRGTPVRNQTYDPPPASGPYAITSSHSGGGWTYARNPEWKPNNAGLMQQLPSGHFNKINIAVISNGSTQVNHVEQNKLDWILGPLPVDRYAELKDKYEGSRFRVEPILSTDYFWMNTSKPPFSDLRVRQAVNYAVDPSVFQKIYAGQLAPSQQILPPDMPGYKRFELYPHNLAKAQQLMAEANPSDRNITVWTDNEAPIREASAYYRDVLQQIGLNAHLKTVSAYNYYAVISNLSTPDLDTGWTSFFEDYPHPSDFFQSQLTGASIFQAYSTNFARIDVAKLNERVTSLGEERLGAKQESEYAALDKEYMEEAPWVPYGNDTTAIFVSKAINLNKVIWDPTFGADLASFQFR